MPAARVCDFPSKAERTQMNDFVVIPYSGQQVSVPKEVADFLEQDRKREQAQEKQDERHLSKSEFETVLPGYDRGLTMEEIGKFYGVSKMAVSKRLRKLHQKLKGSVI